MKLSDIFDAREIVRDAEFTALGRAASDVPGTLAYAETVFYVAEAVANPQVAAVLTTRELADRVAPPRGLVLSGAPRNRFYEIHERLLDAGQAGASMDYGVGARCVIHPSATVSPQTRIGHDVVIRERAVLRDHVSIGDGALIDAGAVIGAEGLLYRIDANGDNVFVRHAGAVRIGAGVAILSNAVIVKSVHGHPVTTVNDHSIVGIGTNVGHEAQVGRNCVIASNCVVARGARIADGAWIGTSSVIREYISVGRGARVQAGSIVVSDVKDAQSVSGNFAVEHRKHLAQYARLRGA